MFNKRILRALLVCYFLFLVIPGYTGAIDHNAKIWVTGHEGLVGSAIVRQLRECGYHNLIVKSHSELDLCNQSSVEDFFKHEQPEFVFLAAAKVGGILANTQYPAEFISENLAIERNIIHGAHLAGVKGLLFLGSACIYPRDCPQPIREEYLLTGSLEPSNEWYAIAKISGLKLCQAYQKQYGDRFISLMPTNLYGPGDNFDLNCSHVIPALIRKFVNAKQQNQPHIVIWGSGIPLRDCLFVDDLAEACVWAMDNYDENQWLNVGSGKEISITELANLIANIVGYEGAIVFDASKPDGTPRRVLDVSKINKLGWKAHTHLREGLEKTIRWYMSNQDKARNKVRNDD
ncbi:MAG: GDP-L-fucose synthase [Chlamydiae bacterium]|nr:GDP-L-fucose synthase [Chlamydiota bacterium]